MARACPASTGATASCTSRCVSTSTPPSPAITIAPNSGSRTPAHQQLDPPVLTLHQHRCPSRQPEQLGGGLSHLRPGAQPQPDPAGVALVDQIRVINLRHHGIAQAVGRGRRGCSAAAAHGLDHRDSARSPAGPVRPGRAGNRSAPRPAAVRAARPSRAGVSGGLASLSGAASLPVPAPRVVPPAAARSTAAHRNARHLCRPLRPREARHTGQVQHPGVLVRGPRRDPAHVDRHRHRVGPQPLPPRPGPPPRPRPTRTAAAAPARSRRPHRTGPACRSRPDTPW